MKRFQITIAGLAALALVLGVGLAGAAGARPGHGGGKIAHLEDQLEELDLDAETRAAVQELLDAARADRREQRAEMREAHETLRALLEQDEPVEDDVLAQAEVIGQLKTEARKRSLRTLLQVRAFLTPGQRAELREAMESRRSKRWGRER